MSNTHPALTRFANNDLNLTRKHGEITVAQTKRGNITLRHEAGVYSAGGFEIKDGKLSEWSVSGTKATIRALLVASYDVQVAE